MDHLNLLHDDLRRTFANIHADDQRGGLVLAMHYLNSCNALPQFLQCTTSVSCMMTYVVLLRNLHANKQGRGGLALSPSSLLTSKGSTADGRQPFAKKHV